MTYSVYQNRCSWEQLQVKKTSQQDSQHCKHFQDQLESSYLQLQSCSHIKFNDPLTSVSFSLVTPPPHILPCPRRSPAHHSPYISPAWGTAAVTQHWPAQFPWQLFPWESLPCSLNKPQGDSSTHKYIDTHTHTQGKAVSSKGRQRFAFLPISRSNYRHRERLGKIQNTDRKG